MESPDKSKWLKAIQSEVNALQKNGTWGIVDRLPGVKVIFCKWALKKERTAKGKVERFKARLVICRNFDDATFSYTFVLVADFTIVRLMVAVAAQRGWLIHQVDNDNAFLQGVLTRKVYMTAPSCMEGVPM